MHDYRRRHDNHWVLSEKAAIPRIQRPVLIMVGVRNVLFHQTGFDDNLRNV